MAFWCISATSATTTTTTTTTTTVPVGCVEGQQQRDARSDHKGWGLSTHVCVHEGAATTTTGGLVTLPTTHKVACCTSAP